MKRITLTKKLSAFQDNIFFQAHVGIADVTAVAVAVADVGFSDVTSVAVHVAVAAAAADVGFE